MGIASLDAALAGLRVSQQQISVISNNVANVSTPGYTRKVLPQSSQSVDGITVGVRSETIIRNVDLNLERDLWTQVSAVGSLDVQKTYLNRIQQFHGAPEAELSIAAEISRLRDSFSALSDVPDDAFLRASVLDDAVSSADKLNDLAGLLNTLRNDAQNDISQTVDRVNDLLEQVAELNDQIQDNANIGRTTAQYEDQRDEAIKELSGLIEISFFQRGDGVLVVQTNRGVELASEKATLLNFNPTPVSATSSYPASVNGIFVGDPDNPSAVDITETMPGGRLGGLLELRDVTLPRQSAQVDELAYNLARRLDEQGLRLFTDRSGSLPANTAPDPTTDPPTPVEYVGFAAEIRVNEQIIDDNELLRNGTYGATLQAGSNEVIRRVLEFGFGSIEYEIAENQDLATQVDLLNTGGLDLQSVLGLSSSNQMLGGRDLAAFASIGDLITSADGALDDPNDQFQITFEEVRTGLGPDTITVDLSDADLAPGVNALDQLVNYINGLAGGVDPGLNVVASAGPNGELQIDTSGSYEIDSNFGPTGIGQTGLNFLGLSDNAGAPVLPEDPYFDVQIGNKEPVRITLEPGDTSVELLNKLDAVPGLAVDTVNFAIDGVLRLRPGDDFDNPDFGGDIRIIGGPFETSGAAYGAPPATTVRTSIDDGVNISSALFGTYSVAGGDIVDEPIVREVAYTSETNASLGPPVPTTSFRQDFLGPNANISTRVIGSSSLIDFSQKIVNQQTQETILVESRQTDEESLRDALETQLLNESGVNLDEELGNLIVFQTAFSASARVVTAVDELFQELLSVLR
ncbi:MAG: flagellar hook-associated protein FlgK [Alphaproteobacteria bacterium]|nr:flagellar hook-associated protein FlgK [Alphaproteobacteria bacterium]